MSPPHGNFWFPHVFEVSKALRLNIEATKGSVEGVITEITAHFSAWGFYRRSLCANAGLEQELCLCREYPCMGPSRPLAAGRTLPADGQAPLTGGALCVGTPSWPSLGPLHPRE